MDKKDQTTTRIDKNEAIEIAPKYIDLVSDKYSIKNVILFGSYAKGNHHADSDIDLAIVMELTDDVIDMQIELMNMRTDNDLLIEPHPFNKADFLATNPVVSEILKDGVEINHRKSKQTPLPVLTSH